MMEFIIKNKKLINIKDPEKDVHIPEGVEKLDADVFNRLKEVENVWFPASLVDNRSHMAVFRDQSNIFVHPANPVYASHDGVLYNKSLTVLYNCPMKKKGIYRTVSSTKCIAAGAFCCCELDELILNDGLETIEVGAFSDSSIRQWVFIPESVIHIDKDAFAGEWSNQCIRVIKDSYAHYYAKQKDSSVWRYRCVPQHGEVVWSEYEWIDKFDSAKRDEDYEKIRFLRREVFLSTISAVQKGEYMTAHGHLIHIPLTADMRTKTRFYASEIHPIPHYPTRYDTQISAVNDDCLRFARRLHKFEEDVCVLNMASRRNPGGGVLGGAGAQEEYLFRCSDYYRSLYQFAPYAAEYCILKSAHTYPLDRDFGGCFSSGVTIFRAPEEEGYRFLHHPWHMNFIAVAGMNRPELTHINGEERIAVYLVDGIKNKIRTIFRIAIDNGQKTLVLGALGCGAFKNPPKHIAELFKEVLQESEFKNIFRRVFFVIKEDHNSREEGNFKPFKDVFGCMEAHEPLIPERQLIIGKDKFDGNKGKVLHQEYFGDNFLWRLYSDGILEISGRGNMPDYINHWNSYFGEGQAPWVGCDKYGVMPYKLVICEEITYIGANAFESFGCLREIVLPQSLIGIGTQAFFDCFNVERINIPCCIDITCFDIAELPMYYNNDYILEEKQLVKKSSLN